MAAAPTPSDGHIIRFLTNVPVETGLKFKDGFEVEGQYGKQYMYTTIDDRKMYLPGIVASRITELGVQPGERIQITKAEVRAGNRRSTEWQVKRVDPDPRCSANPGAAPSGQPMAPQGPQHRNTAPSPHGELAVPRVMPAAPAIPTKIGYGQAITQFLVVSLEAAQAAEKWAAEHSCSVRFTSEDVQGLASTLFIQAARDGVVGWRHE